MKFLDLLTRFVVVLPPVEDDELVRYIVEMGEEFDLGDALLDAPVLDTLLFLPSVGGKPLFITGKRNKEIITRKHYGLPYTRYVNRCQFISNAFASG